MSPMTKPRALAILALSVGALIAWGRLAVHYAAPRVVERRVEVPVPQPAPACKMPEHMTKLGPCDLVMAMPRGETECSCTTMTADEMTYHLQQYFSCSADAGSGIKTADGPW